jgi:hypothetical protein
VEAVEDFGDFGGFDDDAGNGDGGGADMDGFAEEDEGGGSDMDGFSDGEEGGGEGAAASEAAPADEAPAVKVAAPAPEARGPAGAIPAAQKTAAMRSKVRKGVAALPKDKQVASNLNKLITKISQPFVPGYDMTTGALAWACFCFRRSYQ